ncbi:MAG: cytochrome b [Zavarzinia sp.]|nr:cytochrome b [Zavarzinia sp.]
MVANEASARNDYTSIAKLLHWFMAALLIGVWIVGFLLDDMPKGPDKMAMVNLHKAVGSTVIVLVGLRIVWRLFHPVPRLPDSIPPVLQLLARLGQFLLYGLMIGMPVSGWLMSSAFGYPVMMAGIIEMPNPFSAPDPELAQAFAKAHGLMAWILALTVIAHIALALKHHFFAKNDVLLRMLPRLR